jgi:hypothetical protein
VAVQHERQSAEHLALGDLAVDDADDLADPGGEVFVVSHVIPAGGLGGRRPSAKPVISMM